MTNTCKLETQDSDPTGEQSRLSRARRLLPYHTRDLRKERGLGTAKNARERVEEIFAPNGRISWLGATVHSLTNYKVAGLPLGWLSAQNRADGNTCTEVRVRVLGAELLGWS